MATDLPLELNVFVPQPAEWERVIQTLPIDWSVEPVEQFVPGCEAGMEKLFEFVTRKIKSYNNEKNDPNVDALSNISPWLHFGKIFAPYSLTKHSS